MDYERYGDGEMRLAWLDEQFIFDINHRVSSEK
jgi:hypothetical protein